MSFVLPKDGSVPGWKKCIETWRVYEKVGKKYQINGVFFNLVINERVSDFYYKQNNK